MSNAYKRGQLLVDSGFQVRLMARAGVYIFLCTFVSLNIGFFFEFLWARSTGENPGGSFYLDYMSQHRFILIGAIVLLPAVLFDLLKFSNRVSGPLYRCRKVMTQMSRGEAVPEFKPRKHDLMPELFEEFNGLIKEWNARLEQTPTAEPAKNRANGSQALAENLDLVAVSSSN
jgi:hypothetical protein